MALACGHSAARGRPLSPRVVCNEPGSQGDPRGLRGGEAAGLDWASLPGRGVRLPTVQRLKRSAAAWPCPKTCARPPRHAGRASSEERGPGACRPPRQPNAPAGGRSAGAVDGHQTDLGNPDDLEVSVFEIGADRRVDQFARLGPTPRLERGFGAVAGKDLWPEWQ